MIGSTGSIGRQTLSVVAAHPDRFKVVAMVAGGDEAALMRQIAEFKPAYAGLAKGSFNCDYRQVDGTKCFYGEDNCLKMLEECGADAVMVACGGFDGLKYSLKTAELKADLALANKETLVCGGDLVMPAVGNIMPVDSEHSAIWQCLNYDRGAKLKNLIITASGGPFRDRDFESLKGVTPEQALAHPTWKMGKKITVDSATLLNKGYEVIEAHHLYGAPYSSIKTVIQPQSIIHSMVEFDDGAVVAQMSNPTMELPIQLALTYPERLPVPSLQPMDFSKALSLEFLPLERKKYPLYDLALRCGEQGGVLPTALNAASEVAVNAFLGKKAAFTDIYRIADKVVQKTANAEADCYERLAETDLKSRVAAEKIIAEGR